MLEIRDIRDIINGDIINGREDVKIEKFNISYKNHYENEFYIPIFWREDRHKYIMDAVRSGAIGYLISSSCEEYENIIKESKYINPNIVILQVQNVNDAIYKMAIYNRKKNINIPIIAVTGSVGKTSTCEMISSIIRQEKKVLSDNGNNDNTKILLSSLMLDIEDYEIAVMEAGIASKNVMEPISELLQPSIVVINNIGTAHIESLGSKENILQEKLLLTGYMKDHKIVLLNDDDSLLKGMQLDKQYRLVKYSLDEATNIKQEDDTITFNTKVYGENINFTINCYGKHNISNAICAIRIGELLNIEKSNIVKGIKKYKNVDRRFNVIKKNGYTIIDDTYNASLASMKAGLISADNIKTCKRKIAVLGEMLELGEFSVELHTKVGEVFRDISFDVLFTQGNDTQYICKAAKNYIKNKKIINFQNQDELIDNLINEIQEGDLIYLKASKKMNFNKIVQKLIDVI